MSDTVRCFGIRHHGPGSARSLLRAFEAWAPDCVLVEGPPEADGLLGALGSPDLQPPVALLGYAADDPSLAVYHPFAVFSPEWQALAWAQRHGVPARFIDLALAHELAFMAEQRDRDAAPEDAAAAAAAAAAPTDSPAGSPAGSPAEAAAAPPPPATPHTQPPRAPDADPGPGPGAASTPDHHDPLTWLAQAAGQADGEAFWNHLVEERGDGEGLFDAIAEAMGALREAVPTSVAAAGDQSRPMDDDHREALREAAMRQGIRDARKQGFQRIAVVCGAWHVPALQADLPARADAALLKGLPKRKVASTWVPWTHRHLTRASGYRAGIHAPGWYEHLWLASEGDAASPAASPPARPDGPGDGGHGAAVREAGAGAPAAQPGHARPVGETAHGAKAAARSIGWLSRIARLLRERELDCSSAHLIEAARLADALAAMRGRPTPSLDELHEAARGVLLMGDDAPLRFIESALMVGDRMGQVPADVPTVPLQRDVEAQQKSLRLKPEATQRTLDLDLRQPTDRARSRLLHRLALIDLPWGRPLAGASGARGTFHELWTLQWQPEFALRLIEASRWGQTLEQAATTRVAERSLTAEAGGGDLASLSALVDAALLADLDAAARRATEALQRRAALSGDALQLLAALPPLARVSRYGNVRGTDTALVGHVLDELVVRAALAVPLAACGIDDSAAAALRQRLLEAHGAVALRRAERRGAAAGDRPDPPGQDRGDAAGPLVPPAPCDADAPPLHAAAGPDRQPEPGRPTPTGTAMDPRTAATDGPATEPWCQSLRQLAAQPSAHPLLRGLAWRLRLDDALEDAGAVADAMSLQLSAGADPADAAAWLDGFLNGNAQVLLHDAGVWRLLDRWLASLSEEHFLRTLPLVRRSFSAFGPAERRDLGQRARQGTVATPAAVLQPGWNEERAALAVPLLRRLMGLPA